MLFTFLEHRRIIPNTRIMPAGFTFIEQYRTMAKEIEQQSCDSVLNLDAEPRHFLDAEIKTEIKVEAADEQPDLYNMMEYMMGSNSNSSNINSSNSNVRNSTSNSNKIPSNFLSSSQKNGFTNSTRNIDRHTPSSATPQSSSAAVTSATTPLLFSSSRSPMMSSATLPVLSPFSTSNSPLTMTTFSPNLSSIKTSTFVTELAGSGCTVVSNTDFLLDNSITSSSLEGHDDSLEYTDLDKPSMYDDYVPFSNMGKPGAISDESNSVPLEEAVYMMTGTLQSDCDKLGVPYDPLMWKNEDVRRWVSWVCKRNDVPDVSPQLYQFDGVALCSLTHDALSSSLGESGVKISNELELLKAAYSCFPNQITGSILDDSVSAQHLCNPYMENLQMFTLTSCVSPAPSTCSSTHDSNTSTLSTHSDPSDDESGYGSQISSYSVSPKLGQMNDHNRIAAKVPTGRGHKQTIHLWQFLKELLLSKDNHYNDCIRWVDRKAGVFKIEDSKKVASLWGARKNRPAMNYDKLSRSVRQYYKKGIIKKTEQSKRLVYQFCSGYM